MKYEIVASSGLAKSAHMETVHGAIETPVFMNVGTLGAIKGAVSAEDLEEIGTQVMLCNTYHLHVRTGDETVRALGGLRRFTGWRGPILTDSGGFQVFSLSGLRRIREEGVEFSSHIDGHRIWMGPEESMRIQSHLASTIAMAFDECPPATAERSYIAESTARTERWLVRSMEEMRRLRALPDTLNPAQLLFGINQGGVLSDVRRSNALRIGELDLDGYAIGGLAVGESKEEMYETIELVTGLLPREKPTYLMGVGTPTDIIEGVARGVDFFDCVYPSRNARHGHVYTSHGRLNLFNKRFERDEEAIEPGCPCPACRRHSRAYIRHLLKAGEMLGMRLCTLHNLYFYNHLMQEIRTAIRGGTFDSYARDMLSSLEEEDKVE